MKSLYRIAPFALMLGLIGCGSSSTTATPTPTPTPTRGIAVAGNLAFGNVAVGGFADRVFTITNTGNSTLTITSFIVIGGTGTAGFSSNYSSGTIPAGWIQDVTIRFTPTATQTYSHILNVMGDQTGGQNAINVSGTGVVPTATSNR